MLNWIYSISVTDDVALYILVRYMKNLKNNSVSIIIMFYTITA